MKMSVFRKFYSLALLAGILSIASESASAQVSLIGGLNITGIRNDDLLENEKIRADFHAGWAFRVYPFRRQPDLSIQNMVVYSRKGYRQKPEEEYLFRFHYLSFPVLLNYDISNNISMSAGVEPCALIWSNVNNWYNTYDVFDLGLIFVFTCFDHRRISAYSEVSYGLLNILDYYTFDEYGNILGEIHDLRNICISIGLKFNFSNEKAFLFK
jgi:hypothetical protein